MKQIYFISVDKLKQRTPVNFNVEPQLLTMSIWDAQEINIQQATGTVLYEKLKTLVESGDISLPENADYKLLLDTFIENALIQWSLCESLNFVWMKIENKSVTTQSSDSSQPVDVAQFRILQGSIKNKAEFFTQRLTNYLKSNSNLYPEYLENSECDEIKPQKTPYFSGIVLGNGTMNCNNLEHA